MPQMYLPLYPAGSTKINKMLAFENQDGVVTYLNGLMPIFQHAVDDLQSFKMIVSQFYVMGVATQADIVRAFGVNPQLIKRAVKIYKKQGPQGFFEPKKRRGPGVLTDSVLKEAQGFLDGGAAPGEVAKKLGLKVDTVCKAILHKRLHRPSRERR